MTGEPKPYVPGFETDIFISYRHIDNYENWIADLHTFLQARISALLAGEDFRIWRDLKLRGGEALWQTIDPIVAKSWVFLSILTPGFFSSESGCIREAQHFHQAAQANGGLLLGNTCRMMRVVKTPFNGENEPPFFKSIESVEFQFYERPPVDKTQFSEFSSRDGLSGHPRFREEAENLAQQLAGLLQRAREKFQKTDPRSRRCHVFVAQTTADRKSDSEFITRELRDRSDLVHPTDLPLDAVALKARLASDLAPCALSVHVLGSSYGVVPEGESRSLPAIQLEQAQRIRRLVWIPDDLPEADARQKELVEALLAARDPKLEVIPCGRQAFVQHLKDVLDQMENPLRNRQFGKGVYVAYAEQDACHAELKALRNCLLKRGFRVELSVIQGGPDETFRAEEDALRDTDAAIIYFGQVPDQWVYFRRKRILKVVSGFDNVTAYRRALYLGAPKTDAKSTHYMDLPEGTLPEKDGPPLLVLGDCGEFSCTKLDPLLRGVL